MDKQDLKFVVGFGFDNNPVVLYLGGDMAAALFAERVAMESARFHHVNTYRNPTPVKTVNLTEQNL